MRLTWRDGVATIFVMAAAVIYALWISDIAMPDASARMLGAIVLGLGWAGCVVNQTEMAIVYGVDRSRNRPGMPYVVAASAVGAAALGAGALTLLTGNDVTLAILVASTVTLWALATARHVIRSGGHRAGGSGGRFSHPTIRVGDARDRTASADL